MGIGDWGNKLNIKLYFIKADFKILIIILPIKINYGRISS